MSQHLNTEDADLEDRCWRGYHPRAAIPAVALAGLASALIQVSRWWLDAPSDLADRAIALVFYGMTLAVWPALLTTLVYRMVTYTYRITDRLILLDWGFRHPPESPLKLDEIRDVAVRFSWLSRLLGVGSVILRTDGRSVTLLGVQKPDAFATQVWDAATRLAKRETSA